MLNDCATGVDLREWCRRISRTLNAILDPAGAAGASGTLGAKGPAYGAPTAPPPKQVNAATSVTGAYNAVAGFQAFTLAGDRSSSSDSDSNGAKEGDGFGSSSSSEGEDGGSSSGAEADGSDVDGGSSSGEEGNGKAWSVADSDDSDQVASGTTAEVTAAAGGASGQAKTKQSKKKRKKQGDKEKKPKGPDPNVVVGCPEASSGAWGYPFGGPRVNTLFISRRSRRHRLLKWQLATAMASMRQAIAEDDPSQAAAVAAAGVGAGAARLGGGPGGNAPLGLDGGYEQVLASGLLDGTGPVFRIGSGFRLDKPSFWESLPGSSSTWVDLTGPSDPVVLSGCYSVSGLGGNELLVTLRAYNR